MAASVLLALVLRGGSATAIGERLYGWAEPLVRRRALAALVLAGLPLALRLALLPWWPMPYPQIPDEFSYLYAADTFAEGRWSNPTHALWEFFEVPYVLSQPVSASKYPPAQAAVLAFGQAVLGDPWYGVWLSCGCMVAAVYWMLMAWLPRPWAFAGGLVVAVFPAFLSGWMNSYWGGAVAATAGALLMGAWRRLLRWPGARPAVWWGATFGAAWILLLNARPYEGALVLGLPAAVLLVIRRGLRAPSAAALLVPLLAGGALTLAYNQAITGKMWQLPYSLHDQQYAYVGPFWFQPIRPQPVYRQPVIAYTFAFDERRYEELRTFAGLRRRLSDWELTLEYLAPIPLLLPGVWVLWGRGRRRYREVAWLLAVGAVALNLTVFQFPHYAAPFAGLLVLCAATGWRRLAVTDGPWQPWGKAVWLSLGVLAALSAVTALRQRQAELRTPFVTYCRPLIERHLEQDLDEHLIFVTHPRQMTGIVSSWAYNRANLDAAKTVWAADFGDERNQRLLAYFPRRIAWRLDLNDRSVTLQPYRARPGATPIRFNTAP